MRSRPWLAPLWAAVLATVPNLGLLFGTAHLYYEDHARFEVPLMELAARSLCRGELPWWNPMVALGTPLFVDPQSLALHPGTLLACGTDASHALGILVALHLGLLAAGMARLVGRFGVGPTLAVGCGAAVALAGPALSLSTLAPYLMTLAFAPWTWTAAWDWSRAPSAARALVAGALVGAACWSGDPPGALVHAAVACVVAWAGADGTRPLGRGPVLRGLALAGLAAAVVGAAAWGPLLWYVGRSSRAGGLGADEAGRWSTHPAEWLGLFVPHPAGLPLPENTFWPFGRMREVRLFVHSFYVGALLAGCGVVAAIVRRRERTVRALGLATLVLLLIAAGKTTPLWAVVQPLFHYVRYPSKLVPPAVLLVAALGGIGLGRVLAEGRGRGGLWLTAAAVLVGALLAPTVITALGAGGGTPEEIIARAATETRGAGLRAAALASFVAFLAAVRGRLPETWGWRMPAVAAFVLVMDPLVAGMALRWTQPVPFAVPDPGWLPAPAEGRPVPRVMRAAELDETRLHRDEVGYLRESLRHALLMQPFHNIRFGVANLEGYGLTFGESERLTTLFHVDPILLAQVAGADLALAPLAPRLEWVVRGLSGGRLRTLREVPALNVRVLGPASPPLRAFLTSRVTMAEPGGEIALLASAPHVRGVVTRGDVLFEGRRASALQAPQIDALRDAPAGPPIAVQPRALTASVVEIEVAPSSSSLLVLMDTFCEGWHASVDGAPAAIVRVDYVGRGVPVPAGPHVVRFWFELPWLRVAALASWLGTPLLILGVVAARLRKRGRSTS